MITSVTYKLQMYHYAKDISYLCISVYVFKFHTVEKKMIIHSILAWEIPWIEEPGRLQSMQSQRVSYN